MRAHRFFVGDWVVVEYDAQRPAVRGGLYCIAELMPADGQPVRYRAFSPLEMNERILEETWLRRAEEQ